jgi:hypothetical protein
MHLYIIVVAGLLLPQLNSRHQFGPLTVSATVATNGICDLDCPTLIGAKCAFGDSPLLGDSTLPGLNATSTSSSSKNSTTSIDGMHCTCPEFYTGVLCEFKFDSCGDTNLHICYHGGQCQSGAVDAFGNVQHYCDCADAVDPVTSRPYVGKYCELATVATCDDPNDPELFCFNGGMCNSKYP